MFVVSVERGEYDYEKVELGVPGMGTMTPFFHMFLPPGKNHGFKRGVAVQLEVTVSVA